jgi:ATP-dependent helicase/nuclease subunit A
LIETAACAPLFGESSRAELPIAASLSRKDGRRVSISGRIDRLATMPGEVWIADFKAGAPIRREDHARQLSLYREAVRPLFPDAEIRAFLLWIDSGHLEELDRRSLDEAFEDWRQDE